MCSFLKTINEKKINQFFNLGQNLGHFFLTLPRYQNENKCRLTKNPSRMLRTQKSSQRSTPLLAYRSPRYTNPLTFKQRRWPFRFGNQVTHMRKTALRDLRFAPLKFLIESPFPRVLSNKIDTSTVRK